VVESLVAETVAEMVVEMVAENLAVGNLVGKAEESLAAEMVEESPAEEMAEESLVEDMVVAEDSKVAEAYTVGGYKAEDCTAALEAIYSISAFTSKKTVLGNYKLYVYDALEL
jgi:hypothetical protein